MATSFHLFLKNRKKKNGEYPIYLRITHNRKHKYISTGVSVEKKYWNDRSEEVRRSHRSYKSLNKTLQQKIDKAKEAQSELIEHGKDSAKAIKERIKTKETADFFSYADEYLKEKEEAGLYSQLSQGKVAFNKVQEFEGFRSLPFKQIDSDYLDRFQKFLKNKHENKASTIKKTFQPIKKVISQALKDHLIHIDPFRDFDLIKNTNPTKKTKLSIEQINGIQALNLKEDSWPWHTRNAFLFSFYSGGIRIGDLCCLKWKNVEDGRLEYQMNKNEKYFSTELNGYQTEILSRYSGTSNEYIFPFLNNHKKYDDISIRKDISSKTAIINKNLKKIVKQLNKEIKNGRINAPKIKENVTTHVARHSFAQYAVEKGLNMYKMKQTLRHKKMETTMKYLKSLDEELADKAMKEVF